MNKVELYDFVDCLLVGFCVDETLSTLQVISEAYLKLPYDKNGNDVRANEIYSIQCIENEIGKVSVILNSDFLQFELTCSQIDIVEIESL